MIVEGVMHYILGKVNTNNNFPRISLNLKNHIKGTCIYVFDILILVKLLGQTKLSLDGLKN